MWEKIGYHKNIIFVILAIVIAIMWLSVPEEEIEDPYIINIEYDCREIVRDPSDIPTDIVRQCKELVNELEKEYAPKQSQRGTRT